eukprot:gb/GFBE01002086.1/.p1 GENE.gb/GFBE01002086.1/~~gb/GFBE01002086.1/.p1  ORF type:complete len:714 (+),score=138.80 gb/GFBE01002086.1/:1-2142(+)
MASPCGLIASGRCSSQKQHGIDGQDELDVVFEAQVFTEFGSEVLAVGQVDLLGAWQPQMGLLLQTGPQDYPVWSGKVRLRMSDYGEVLQYKFVVRLANGSYAWEAGHNREVRLLQKASAEPKLVLANGSGASNRPQKSLQLYREWVAVTFEGIWHDSLPGDSLVVVGACPELGSWQPSCGLHLITSATSFPAWQATEWIKLPCQGASEVAFKFVAVRGNGSVEWENAQDRVAALHRGAGHICIRASFGNPEAKTEVLQTPAPVPMLWKGLKGASQRKAESSTHGKRDLTARILQCSLQLTPSSDSYGCGTMPIVAPSISSISGSTEWDEADQETDEDESYESGESEQRFFAEATYEQCLIKELSMLLNCAQPCAHPAARKVTLWPSSARLSKVDAPCEDSFFYCANALGVADGVGQMAQFAKYGADSAAYATDLMVRASEVLQEPSRRTIGDRLQAPEARARAALAYAEKEAQTYGASTACVLVLDDEEESCQASETEPKDAKASCVAGVANLGDSGFMVLRRCSGEGDAPAMQVIARSKEQQHSFNFPYQLMRLPPALLRRVPKGRKLDTSADCDTYRVQLCEGDLILLYSDGLVDNLHEAEILDVVNSLLHRELQQDSRGSFGMCDSLIAPATIAKSLALAAQKRSLDPEAEVPFSLASTLHGVQSQGGKQDDITVVTAWVVPHSTAEDAAEAAGLEQAAGFEPTIGDVLQ